MRAKGLLYFLALFVAAPLVAQTAISADGVVESTSGGFRFPDGTVQESAVFQRCLSTRFLDQGDGTVFDCWVGLNWLKNANCFGPSNWQQAMDATAALASGQCGLTDGSQAGDWRQPTAVDWIRIMDGMSDSLRHLGLCPKPD